MQAIDPTNKRYDVCVCGSGPAGSILAVELVRLGLDVIILEYGGSSNGSSLESVANTENVQGEKSPLFNFARELGGSSNLWSGRTSFFERVDFELNEWPVDFDDLRNDLEDAKNILGMHEIDLDQLYRLFSNSQLEPLLQRPFGLKPFVMQHHSKPFNAKEYLLKNASEHLSIALNSYVTHVIENDHGRITGVSFKCLRTNQKKEISADAVVLATGGLDVPRILLKSSLSALKNCDSIGRYFSTHPKFYVGEIELKRKIRAKNALIGDQLQNGQYIRFGLGFDSEYLLNKNLLNHYVQVAPQIEAFSTDTLDRISNESRMISFLYRRGGLMKNFVVSIGKYVFMFSQRLASKFGYYSKFSLKLHCDQFPSNENTVFLSKDKDISGEYKVEISWKFSKEDTENVRQFLYSLKEEIERANVGKLILNDEIHEGSWTMIGLHSHFLGTTRMGKDASNSVTDSFGKVHGYENLYISGPSLFPGYGYSNPFLPIAAFALRIARKIAGSIPSNKPNSTQPDQ